MELKTAESRRFRFAASVQAWTWLAVFASVAMCLAIIGLQNHQEETLRRYRRLLTDLREARVDLARGYLHLSLSSDRLSPFSREEGLALLDQSIEALREVQGQITPAVTPPARNGGLVGEFQAKSGAFREQLTAYCGAGPAALRDREVSLRLSFHELERLVQRMDDAGQGALQALSARLHAQIAATLTVSVALLSLVCLGVYRVGRRKQAAVRALHANQARLQESEARFKALFEQAAVGVAEIETATGRFLHVNQRYCDSVGYSREELLRLTHQALAHPDDLPACLAQMERFKAGTVREFAMEKRCRRKDGEVLWAALTVAPLWTPDGQPPRHVAVVQDITARKRGEHELEALARQRQLALDAAQMGWWSYNPVTRVSTLDDGYRKIFGVAGQTLPTDEILAQRIHPDDLPALWPKVEAALDPASPQPYAAEYRIRRGGDGQVRWIRAYGAATFEGEGAARRAVNLVGTVEDITERKQAEERLRESQERYRALVETTFDWVWEVDTEGRYTYVSPKVGELLGYAPGEVLGRTPFDLMPEAEARRVGALFQAIASRREPFSALENTNRHRDGRDVVLESSGVPTFDASGRFRGYRGMDRDITARKTAEAALRRSEAHLRTLVNTLPDLVWLKDPQGVYLACNARFETFFGAAAADIVGKTDYDFLSRAVADAFRANDAAAVTDGGPRMNEEEVTFASDGHKEFLETIKTAMFDAEGGLIGVLGIAHDITARKQAEEALRQSEARRALALDAAQAGTWEWDLATGRNTWSDKLWRLYGLEPHSAEPSYEVWRAAVCPDDLERVEQTLKEVVPKAAELILEWRVNAASDDLRWMLSRGRPVRDASGRVTHYAGVVMDITARKRAELALEAEAGRMSALLDAQREIASTDLEYADLIQLVLARMSRLAGAEGASLEMAEGDEMVYEAATGLAAPFAGLRLKIAESLSGFCMKSGALMRSDDIETDSRVDREACRRIGLRSMILLPLRYDEHTFGVLKLMSSDAAAFSADAEQSLRLMGGFLGATVSRKRTEMLLREREERLQTLGDNIPGGVIYQLHSPREGRSRYTYISAGIERIFGIPAASVLADPAPFWDLIVKEDRAAAAEVHARSLRELSLFDREFRQRTVSGELKWLHAIARPRRLADGSTIWDGVLMDITARKRAESERATLEDQLRQSQRLESVGRLAGGVAHDFNNLLMSIMGHAELCREGLGKGHPSCADLDGIMDAAQRSAGITRQLLAFARQQTVAPVVLNVNDHVANTLKLLQRLIGENVELTWRPGAQQALVKMDPSQLDQVLTNLAVNARDAIAGVGRITVETKEVFFDAQTCPKQEEAAPGAYVMLAFSDTGCGMDRQTLEHIFEPFFTTKLVGQGTGLGLATVYGIVKQNKGLIDVQSEPGKGATFRIFLRRQEEPAEAAGARPAAPEMPGGSETVLLVEDEDGVRSVTARFLRRLGYTVLSAGEPAAALRLISEHVGRVHLLITDVVMPGMSGRDLAAKLSAAYPGIKCLLMSGYPDGGVAHLGTVEEGLSFLAKPFSSDAFARKVREVLGSP